ncbi:MULTISPECIES: LacI family DNA-binding transcriptional regulator [unclassified Mycoplasma]|uniref:LacI family DNA-binding transcriptional regulator n=1 Tax=unclassified Mycoplasma TaxID=2683645 RepID=UPI00211B7D69|nr:MULTISPECIES: LacI family DNA-binding transcriptional regulator [unclassified Mycoplasma]UUM19506.1 LacI family transcriptional regulator [Mycoplasma sp. 1578d]UUM25129.1 LacI family transcriptional regulator [Mycoplasma sp. 3686d]
MSKQISYKDISEKVRVSISTISRYYNNGYVSEKTKKKIEEFVKSHQYYPNHGARLIRGRDHSIFIIMPEWTQNIYFSIVNGIVAACKKNNRKVNITFTGKTTEEYIETVRYILSWRPTSLVIFNPDRDENLFNFLRSIVDVSIVIYDHQVSGLNWIKVDETNAFYELTLALISTLNISEKGKVQMVFLEDSKLYPIQKKDRFAGFERACKEKGINYERTEVSFNNSNTVKSFLALTRNKQISNVVCSTHESYISLTVQGIPNLRLTDIGYQSIYDRIKNYKAKIFIDFPSIGIEIEKMLLIHSVEKQTQNKFIKARIIT